MEQAYLLSVDELGLSHFSTNISRLYYYKYLIFKEEYIAAIPLAHEIIKVEKKIRNNQFEILDRVNQLYALYGLTEQWPEEEAALKQVVTLTEELIGKESEDYKAATLALSGNYCIQKKYHEYFELVNKNGLPADCDLN
jgi:hypothetical protein